MTTHVSTPADLIPLVGQPMGETAWREITQERVNQFADATDDHQWIHVDLERATAGPFGGTIAHGYLTLSLLPLFLAETVEVERVTAGLNYGLNKVRFPQPVPVGARVRAVVGLVAAKERGTGIEATFGVTVELEGAAKPACVAEAVVLYQ